MKNFLSEPSYCNTFVHEQQITIKPENKYSYVAEKNIPMDVWQNYK